MTGFIEKFFSEPAPHKIPAPVKQVSGVLERCGFFFRDEYWHGYRMLLEGDNTPYLLAGRAFKQHRCAELMQAGDEVSFGINERFQVTEGTFVNKTLQARLNHKSAK